MKQTRNNVYYVNLPLILTGVQKYFEILIFVNFLTAIKYFGKEASPGDPRRFLLSSMVLIVTGEIPGPIFQCGATRLTPMPWTMYCVLLPNVSRKFLVLGN